MKQPENLRGLRTSGSRDYRQPKYHHAKLHADWRVEHHARFCLDYLPPYSPDLNPIERVWKLTRRNCLHNRYFQTLKHIENVVEEQFDMWRNSNDTLRRLCAIK
jgi:transposase